MAKNYTFNEAVQIIANGQDLEAITDIGRRYPVLLNKVTKVAAKAGQDFVDLMGYMPEYLTANKVNSAIKATVQESDGANDEDDTTDAPEAAAEATEEVAGGAEWNENMSAKQLWDVLGKAGKRKLAKSTKKADLIEACKQAFGGATAEAEDADDEEEAAESDNPYEGKSAMELFKECKARKIKAAPKKPAKFYADLLIKDDAAKAEAETAKAESDDSDDWNDDEEEAKPAKKAAKSTKAAKKDEAADDDDWDI